MSLARTSPAGRSNRHFFLLVPFCDVGFRKVTSQCWIAMNTPLTKIRRFLTSEDGPSATSYAVMLAVIAVAYVVACRYVLGT